MQKVVIAILGVLLIVGMGIFVLMDNASGPTNKQKTESSSQVSTSEQAAIKPPIPIKGADITAPAFYYIIDAPIKELKKDGQRYALSLTTTNNYIPAFPIKSEVRVNKAKLEAGKGLSKSTEAAFADLKPGVQIRLSAYYNIQEKEWTVPIITIVEQ